MDYRPKIKNNSSYASAIALSGEDPELMNEEIIKNAYELDEDDIEVI